MDDFWVILEFFGVFFWSFFGKILGFLLGTESFLWGWVLNAWILILGTGFYLYCKIPDIFRQWRNMLGSILFVLTFSKSADYFGNFLGIL
jgi:hypothetical protein